MQRVSVVLLVLGAACTPTTPPPAPTRVEPAASKPTPPPPTDTAKVEADTALPEPEPMPGQWTCVNDVDCAQTCALGAVSRAWLARNRDADPCDDGCGWKSGNQACRDGECVTLTADGDIDESCTKRPVPPPR